MERTRRLRSERPFLLDLRLAHELLEAPLPAPIRNHVYDHTRLHRWPKGKFHRPRGTSQISSALAYNLQIRDRLRDGLGLCIPYIPMAVLELSRHLRKWAKTMWT